MRKDEAIRQQFFPMKLPAGVTGCLVDHDIARQAIKIIEPQIFPPREKLGLFVPPQTRRGSLKEAGRRYRPSSSEYVLFYHNYPNEDEPVGWLHGYMEDKETFFIVTVGLIATFRGRGIYTTFLKGLIAYLAAAGYERLTTSHHPNNRAIMIAELKAGFNITGLELHEGYGSLVKMTYLFHQDRRESFEQAFSMAPDPTRQI